MSERDIQNRILVEICKAYAGRGIFWKNDTGAAKSMDGKRVIKFGLPGSSDILGCLAGRIVCLEVKTATGSQSDAQRRFEAAIKRAGGLYAVVRSPAEAMAVLAQIEAA